MGLDDYELECDYLVVGTGVMGMAFADVVVTHSNDRTMILVDKNVDPGGHWNQAYKFARLHQPAAYYGVASEPLEKSPESYRDLSSRDEILEYYRFVLDKLLKTGRISHFGECTYNDGDDRRPTVTPGAIHSFTDKQGISHRVRVKRKVVDATYLKPEIPATHSLQYDVEDGLECIPINNIHGINQGSRNDSKKKFVVIGAGKTGIDAVLYLLDNGIEPAKITWVMPRDSWLLNRACIDPRKVPFGMEAMFDVTFSLKESLLRREKEGLLLRLDASVWPEKYSCATVDPEELEKLRLIRNVIRKGRVLSITKTHLVMTGKKYDQLGEHQQRVLVPYDNNQGDSSSSRVVFVDCSAMGLPTRPPVPIFHPGGIIIQPVRYCQAAFSAAMVAYIECHPDFRDDDDRNSVVVPVPFPNSNQDGLRTELLGIHNILMLYGEDPRTKHFFKSCRLNLQSHCGTASRIKLLSGALYHLVGTMAKSIETKKQQYRDEFDGKDFEFETYSPKRMRKTKRMALIMSLCFYGVVFVVLTVFYHIMFFLKIAYLDSLSSRL